MVRKCRAYHESAHLNGPYHSCRIPNSCIIQPQFCSPSTDEVKWQLRPIEHRPPHRPARLSPRVLLPQQSSSPIWHLQPVPRPRPPVAIQALPKHRLLRPHTPSDTKPLPGWLRRKPCCLAFGFLAWQWPAPITSCTGRSTAEPWVPMRPSASLSAPALCCPCLSLFVSRPSRVIP
jgi:hypothetical protein